MVKIGEDYYRRNLNSPYWLPYISSNVCSENLMLHQQNQLTIFFLYSHHLIVRLIDNELIL